MRDKIVKFDNGRYGVRCWGVLGYKFRDFKSRGFCWRPGDIYFRDCLGTKAKAIEVLERKNRTYVVVGIHDVEEAPPERPVFRIVQPKD